MRFIFTTIFIALVQPIFCQVFTHEQKDFCITTFKKYLKVEEKLINERVQAIQEHEEWYRQNVVHIDSVMNVCIELVQQDESIKLADLLEKERYNIYAHPHNDTYLCYEFHSVLALIYSKTIESEKEYFIKVADLGEYSKLLIEAVQANWEKPHPLYLQVLNELQQIYDMLGNQSKKTEIELLIKQSKDSF